jgi:hypothetical protein
MNNSLLHPGRIAYYKEKYLRLNMAMQLGYSYLVDCSMERKRANKK